MLLGDDGKHSALWDLELAYFVVGHYKSAFFISSHISVKSLRYVFCHKSSLLSDSELVAQDKVVINVDRYKTLLDTLFLSSGSIS